MISAIETDDNFIFIYSILLLETLKAFLLQFSREFWLGFLSKLDEECLA